jgi:hypothetical protein
LSILADPLYSHALLYRLAIVHVFFFLKLLDHHCHRMDDMQHESEASRWKPFSHDTIQPPNQPNGVAWLAEADAHGEVPACSPGHNSF